MKWNALNATSFCILDVQVLENRFFRKLYEIANGTFSYSKYKSNKNSLKLTSSDASKEKNSPFSDYIIAELVRYVKVMRKNLINLIIDWRIIYHILNKYK